MNRAGDNARHEPSPQPGEPGELGDRTRRALADLVGFADEINRYVVAQGEENFLADRPTQYVAEALVHRIGEAVSRLPDEFTADHVEVRWRKMKAMRNAVAYEYGFIDYRIVWRALSGDLPRDIAAVQRILDATPR